MLGLLAHPQAHGNTVGKDDAPVGSNEAGIVGRLPRASIGGNKVNNTHGFLSGDSGVVILALKWAVAINAGWLLILAIILWRICNE